MASPYVELSKAYVEQERQVDKAVTLIFRYGMIDGAHHKQWVLDQVLRLLRSDRYDLEIEDYDDWDTGIAP